MRLWDVKHKKFHFHRFDISFQLAEFNFGSLGLGVDLYYNSHPAFHRYDRHGWLNVKLLWADASMYLDWGRKQWHLAMMRRMVMSPDEIRQRRGLE